MVARLREDTGFTESPGAMALSAADDNGTHSERISHMLACEMRAVGINWTYAPVVDLSYNAENPTVGTRSYGRNPQTVGQMAAAAVQGFQGGDVAACAKHFPGLGDTAVDSHLALPALDTPVDTLIQTDLEPYRQVIASGVASVMTTHTLFTTLDEQHPATLSPVIIQQLLRDELAFQGVVTTDCMEMNAITEHYGAGESAVLAALAGVDTILFSHTRARQDEAYQALLEAAHSGRIPRDNLEQSVQRIQAMKARFALDVSEIQPERVGTDKHRGQSLEAARAGVIAVKQGTGFPLDAANDNLKIGLVEYVPGAGNIVESYGQSDDDAQTVQSRLHLLTHLAEHLPDIQGIQLNAYSGRAVTQTQDDLIAFVSQVDVLIVATRNAHLHPEQKARTEKLLTHASQSILVCLKNPYDADVLHADTVICTCGDSVPSLQAVAEALTGDFQPTGTRPVTGEA
jgi:beta-N-acetylhexosaminidase